MKNTNNKGGFLLKFLLAFVLLIGFVLPYVGWGAGKVEAAVIHGWEKFSVSSVPQWSVVHLGSRTSQGGSSNDGYSSYTIDATTGQVKLNNKGWGTYYYSSGYDGPVGTLFYQQTSYNSGGSSCQPVSGGGMAHCWTSDYTYYGKASVLVREKGTYIEVVSSSNRNAYSDNGVTGGYWYVYKGVINNEPQLSVSNTNEQLFSEVDGNNVFQLNGDVSDSDIGDSLIVKYTIDGLPNHQNNTIN